MSKPDWLIELVKHAIWADSLNFLYLLLLSTSKIQLNPRLPYESLCRHIVIILIFLEDPYEITSMSMCTETHG
jgi:hypothetical protein